MIIAIVNSKGGVAKTTSAVHIAYQLSQLGATALVDADPNRSSRAWAGRANSAFPFKVLSELELIGFQGKFQHIVTDTKARPESEDLEAVLNAADLVILPSTPGCDDLRVTTNTARVLQKLGSNKHQVLLTKVSTHPRSKDEEDARASLIEQAIPIFQGRIRHYAVYDKAFLQGIPVFQVRGDVKAKVAWSDYQTVFKEVLTWLAS